jgi:hypothetical protein
MYNLKEIIGLGVLWYARIPIVSIWCMGVSVRMKNPLKFNHCNPNTHVKGSIRIQL